MKKPNLLTAIGALGIIVATSGLILDAIYPSQINFITPPDAAAHGSNTTPANITIPELNINLTVEPGIIKNNQWSVSNTNANHLITSANPGDPGNIIMYGHDDRSIFGHLKQAKVGQIITIKDSQEALHHYRIEQIVTVTPNDASIIAPTKIETLTIYTCTGFANSKRLVVKATPVDL